MTPEFWRDKSVLVTGHTGFKGGWLCTWLQQLGSEVHGYALKPASEPNLFDCLGLREKIASHTIGDITDRDRLAKTIAQGKPDVILHLAAQPLVLRSYEDPFETYQTNVMGTVALLDAARHHDRVRSVVNVTTDKCYENQEWVWPYRENEPMGGHDPYSNSKGCSELVTSAFRRSFYRSTNCGLASARAGNVIGGGDWAAHRLIPDFLRSIDNGVDIVIRSPDATRPWQHVLEPLAGYLRLAERLYQNPEEFAEGFNFGPRDEDAKPVKWIVEKLCSMVEGSQWKLDKDPSFHEANSLKLDSSKAAQKLDWHPRWNLSTALTMTLQWHQAWRRGEAMGQITGTQIDKYQNGGI